MKIPAAPKTLRQLSTFVQQGEGPTLEFKRSTGELKEAMQTVCAFLNGQGGTVLFGVRNDGRIEGQQVADATLRQVAQAISHLEPPASIGIDRIKVDGDKEVIVLSVARDAADRPFALDGRAFERIASTTRRMPQARYEKLFNARSRAHKGWENQPAEKVALKDLDRAEILRFRAAAIQQGRIPAGTSSNVGELLSRLGLRDGETITNAAQVLFGKKFLPYYPQCLVKMGRFRGTTIIGEIVDNRFEYLNAFAAVREGMAFLERTLPLGARFPKGRIEREDRLPIPRDALREILLNAVMHRDYSLANGAVEIVVFDDRVEIRSSGRLPEGISLKSLTREHLSVRRNLLISDAFHRTGAVEVWGRGTNRVITACRKHGIPGPTFKEMQGWLVVTFRAEMGFSQATREKPRVMTGEKTREKLLRLIRENPKVTTAELAASIGLTVKGIDWNLKKLKEAKLLRRIGPAKGGRWEVIDGP